MRLSLMLAFFTDIRRQYTVVAAARHATRCFYVTISPYHAMPPRPCFTLELSVVDDDMIEITLPIYAPPPLIFNTRSVIIRSLRCQRIRRAMPAPSLPPLRAAAASLRLRRHDAAAVSPRLDYALPTCATLYERHATIR